VEEKIIRALQILSLAMIWVFVLAVNSWILSLLSVARKLDDAINASVAIGIVAIPLFVLIASILTYVFFGLRKYRLKDEVPGWEKKP
jgi:ABC-type dipeptide/oligopeptide/nickel transport system permease component